LPKQKRHATKQLQGHEEVAMLERLLQRILFASRWLLAPFFLLLVVGLAALLVKAIQHTYTVGAHLLTASDTQVIVDLLGYVDLTLTASLIVIVIFSGYENFVSRFNVDREGSWPTWLTKIDFGGLKLKLVSSIVAISAVELLRAFMDVQNTPDRDLKWYVIVLLTFVVTGLLLAVTDRLTSEKPPGQDPHS
jgi:uncharacterized protein (TIGR00645 family)